jgi:hypothetical protein
VGHSGAVTSLTNVRALLQHGPAALPRLTTPELEHAVLAFTREEIRAQFQGDPWMSNYLANTWEFVAGESRLTTYPWNVVIPIADICNASCTFCDSWLRGRRWLRLEEVGGLEPVLRNAYELGLQGHGEPLIHPDLDELGARIGGMLDDRCQVHVITNGVHLERKLHVLSQLKVKTFNVSLNAVTPETHNVVMGLGKNALERVVGAVRNLIQERNGGTFMRITISCVVVRQNIHEAARFVEFGNELGVDRIYLRTLSPQDRLQPGLNYHTLPPYLHPEFERHRQDAVRAVAASRVPIVGEPATWDKPIFGKELWEHLQANPPPVRSSLEARADKSIQALHDANAKEPPRTRGRRLPNAQALMAADAEDPSNPYNRAARYSCRFPYQNLNLFDFLFKLHPCCYMSDVPGHEGVHFDPSQDFMEFWNSPAFVQLRQRLVSGPLFLPCRRCPAAY